MKSKSGKRYGRAIVPILILSLCMILFAGCGSSEEADDTAEETNTEFDIAGTEWDNDEDEYSLIFYDDGTGVQSDAWSEIEFTYTWDGTTVVLTFEEYDITTEGTIDSDGYLICDDDLFVETVSASYYPGSESGGMESDLAGSWTHSSEEIYLDFDGVDTVVYDRPESSGMGSYSYDGDTLIISVYGDSGDVEDYEGYIDDDGDIIIDLWGTGGYFTFVGGSDDTASDDSGDGSYFSLEAAFDNDEALISVQFYIDDTCVISDAYESYDSDYVIYEDGSLYIDSYDGTVSVSGYFDYDEYTFYLDDYDGEFYEVDAAFYTP